MKTPLQPATQLTPELAGALGSRRAALLRRIVRKSGLPPEAVIDLAFAMVDMATKGLALSPISRQAVGLGTARWRNVDPEARSAAMRRAVQVRWAKHRKNTSKSDD